MSMTKFSITALLLLPAATLAGRAHRRIDVRQPFQAQPAQCHHYVGAERCRGSFHAACHARAGPSRIRLSFKGCLLSAV